MRPFDIIEISKICSAMNIKVVIRYTQMCSD